MKHTAGLTPAPAASPLLVTLKKKRPFKTGVDRLRALAVRNRIILEQLDLGTPTYEIAQLTGITRGRIYQILKKLDIKTNRPRGRPPKPKKAAPRKT